MRFSENKYYLYLIFSLVLFTVLLIGVLLVALLDYQIGEQLYSYINIIASLAGLSIFMALYEILLSRGLLSFIGHFFLQTILVIGQVALIYFLVKEISDERTSGI